LVGSYRKGETVVAGTILEKAGKQRSREAEEQGR
jgi:hypothetical protein